MIRRILMLLMAVSIAACNSGPPQSADNSVGGANVVSSAHVPLSKEARSLSLDWGKNARAGQVAIADVVTYGGPKVTITPPTEWTLIRDDSTETTRQSLYWHALAANEASTPTWQFSEPVDAQGAIVLLDNVAQGSPIDMSSGATGNGGTVTAKSIATTANADLILSFFASDFRLAGLKPSLPGDAATVMDEEQAPNEIWVLASYQTQLGPSEDQVCSAAQLFHWTAAQVAIKKGTANS
ncbi:MAG: hypothetical protein WBV36_09765 [Terriglobales bacterium]